MPPSEFSIISDLSSHKTCRHGRRTLTIFARFRAKFIFFQWQFFLIFNSDSGFPVVTVVFPDKMQLMVENFDILPQKVIINFYSFNEINGKTTGKLTSIECLAKTWIPFKNPEIYCKFQKTFSWSCGF